MNVNDLKPPRHNKAMSMWRGAGILMGNLVVINTCINGFFLFNNLSFLYNFFIFYFVLRYKYHVIKY